MPKSEECCHTGVVSHDNVQIDFTYTALNVIYIMAAGTQNAYLSAPCSNKYWTRCVPEFGSDYEGKRRLLFFNLSMDFPVQERTS